MFPTKGILLIEENSCTVTKARHFTKKSWKFWWRTGRIVESKEEIASIRKNWYDYLEDMDMTSRYPTAMAYEESPTGKPRWEHDDNKIQYFRNILNVGDETIPLSMVECAVDFKEVPAEERIFAVLSNRNKSGMRLFYTFENSISGKLPLCFLMLKNTITHI